MTTKLSKAELKSISKQMAEYTSELNEKKDEMNRKKKEVKRIKDVMDHHEKNKKDYSHFVNDLLEKDEGTNFLNPDYFEIIKQCDKKYFDLLLEIEKFIKSKLLKL